MAYLVTHFILVAGHEYSTKGLDFDRMCTHRAQEWIDTLRAKVRSNGTFSSTHITPPVTLRFLRFHVTKGVIEYIDFDLDLKTGGKVVALTEASWTPIANYSGDASTDPRKVCPTRTLRAIADSDYKPLKPGHHYHAFITGSQADGVMSITDVYSTVQQMGQKDPFQYSLMELSFFSHGWPHGPILVNSSQAHGTPKDERDPLDKDGRLKDWRKDMADPDADDTARTNFVNAFAAIQGFVQVWGCVAESTMRHVLVEAFVKRRFQSDDVATKLRRLQPIDDGTSFDFDFSDSDTVDGKTIPWTDDYSDDDTFFPDDPSETTFSRTFLDIKQLLARLIKDTYVYRCTRHAGLLAKGAIYGMEGDDEKTKKYNLMRICIDQTPTPSPKPAKWNPECPVGYAPYLQFFDTYLGLKHDPIRGYGIFDSNVVTTIKNLAP